jgi:MFS family permease
MTTADTLSYSLLAAIVIGLVVVTINYAKGLRGSPRELWLLYGYKFSELMGYKIVALSVVLWLSVDCGLSDKAAGNLYSGYSLFASAMGIVVGALIDTAGIRRVMFASIGLLLFARFSMIWLTTPILAFLLGLAPMALGFAIVSPLTTVAIKRFTNKAGAAYGFSLFYVLMNLGFTFGNIIYDKATDYFGQKDASGKNIDQSHGVDFAGHHFSTYQLLFVGALCATVVSLLLTIPMRDGVERDEDGVKIRPRARASGNVLATARTTAIETWRMISGVSRERFFWAFLGMIGILMFVKSVFIQWDLVLPKYCPRVMGEGAKVGAINNVNTILILFFVPLVTMTTARVKSYTLMIVGSAISTLACIITAIPESVFAPLTNTTLGQMVFINWLGLAKSAEDLAAAPPSPFYWSLIFSFLVFTIGEAIWSPRFYQFTAEIAPKGKEATYLSLAVLPTFASKLFVGPMSGWLLETYVPVDAHNKPLEHPHHHMVWVWIGVSAAITPVGMLLYRKFFERETEKVGAHLVDA